MLHLEERKEAEKLVRELEEEQKQLVEEKKRAAAERIRMRLMKFSNLDLEKERQEKLKKHQECELTFSLLIFDRSKKIKG